MHAGVTGATRCRVLARRVPWTHSCAARASPQDADDIRTEVVLALPAAAAEPAATELASPALP
jgi:hypothetical protein